MFDGIDVVQVKKDIEACIGQKVKLKSKAEKNKFKEKEGKICSTTADCFFVKYDDIYKKDSFTYKDVLTNSVEISVADDKQAYHTLFGENDTNIF